MPAKRGTGRMGTMAFARPDWSFGSRRSVHDKLAALRELRVGARGEVEAARPALPAAHLGDAHLDSPLACTGILRRVDPPNPLPAGHWRNRFPELLDFSWGARQSLSEIRRNTRLRPVLGRLDLHFGRITRNGPGASLQLRVDPHPVTEVSVRFDDRLERAPVDRAAHSHLAPGGELLARHLGQAKDRPPTYRLQLGLETDR